MKKLILMLLLLGSVNAFAQTANFNGNWTINNEKSNFGDYPPYMLPKTIKVKQTNDGFIISRILLDEQLNELMAVTDSLSLDQKPFHRTDASGRSITTSIKMGNESTLTLMGKTASDGTIDVNDVWTITEDKKALVINRTVKQSDGLQYTIKGYYDKQ